MNYSDRRTCWFNLPRLDMKRVVFLAILVNLMLLMGCDDMVLEYRDIAGFSAKTVDKKEALPTGGPYR